MGKIYKVADLFCGAGGLSLGFEREGSFKVIAAVENNQAARETYLMNHKRTDIAQHFREDVCSVNFQDLNIEVKGIDVVIGGPPCQGFSNANRQQNHVVNMNNQLVKDYFRAVREIQPKVFVLENVSMLKSATHRFFDSDIDHDEMIRLDVPMTDNSVFISDEREQFTILKKINRNPNLLDNYQISQKLYRLLNVLLKKKSDDARDHYLKAYKHQIRAAITSVDNNVKSKLVKLLHFVETDNFSTDYVHLLRKILTFQKSLQTFQELKTNRIRFVLSLNEDGQLEAEVKTYSVLDYIHNILRNTYQTFDNVYEATNFGVPQHRHRFLLIGFKKNELPASVTKIDGSALIDHRVDYIPNVHDAIADLEKVPASYAVKGPVPTQKEMKRSQYAETLRDHSTKKIFNHIVPKSTPTVIERFKAIEQGKNFHSLPDNLKTTYAVPDRTQNTIYLRVLYKEPSGTVVNVRKSMWIHPTLQRAISVREAARLQSFPDSYHFYGPKDSQYQQVGNAVPPLLAQGVAEYIRSVLDAS